MVRKLASITETTVIFVILACIGSDFGDCDGAHVGRWLWLGFSFSLPSSIPYSVVSLELVNGFRRFASGIVTKRFFNNGFLADDWSLQRCACCEFRRQLGTLRRVTIFSELSRVGSDAPSFSETLFNAERHSPEWCNRYIFYSGS
ncbi:hypothetical protein M441DRAFT_390156 [Trichoderma asperellum CBS 433.97]|uniref:Uncharacterized protein n=1 Tax=Trichoderma asperellum (strain ATCC 204424 / CBS 433.97 / NBRC 101777) TaxID=1042311 RepID=A0A2T3ZC96_TRIA4|nr:hypothetical protein M441DRAFT_390156 [Trichoderma asperellum CBS 433.97]PTB42428.1 hypothetical protein M441DRAFT_390156 [Trichoderma asperellum CBS 433.97]